MLKFPLIFLLIAFVYCVQPSPVFGQSKSPQLPAQMGDTTLILCYNAVSCSCAQWSECNLDDRDSAAFRVYLYLERANMQLTDADVLWEGNNLPLRIRVTGRFVTESGYPEGFKSKGMSGKEAPEPGKVFRYERILVLQNGSR